MADFLIFSAHPDDAEFGMGGTILKLIDEGFEVAVCVLTLGESGTYGSPEIRRKEMNKAAEMAGFELEILDFKDCKVFDNFNSRVELARVIRKYQPRIIFAPYHTQHGSHRDGRAHPDHVATGEIARFAARYAKFDGLDELDGESWCADQIVYYMVPGQRRLQFVCDVSDYIEEWEELVKCYESQMNLMDGEVLQFLKDRRREIGDFLAVEYGEDFLVDDLYTDLEFLSNV